MVRRGCSSRVTLQLLLPVILSLLAPAGRAQRLTNGDDVSVPEPASGHDYIGLLNDTVNPANGSLQLQFHLPVPKGRGITLPASLTYNSNAMYIYPMLGSTGWNSTAGLSGQRQLVSDGNWSFSVPFVTATQGTAAQYSNTTTYYCNFATYYMFMDATGVQHPLNLDYADVTVPGLPFACQYSESLGMENGSSVLSGGDGHVLAALSSNSIMSSLLVSDEEGTVYHFPAPTFYLGSTPDFIEDRNGNKIIPSFPGTKQGVFTFTDDAGRAVVASSGIGPAGATTTFSTTDLTYQIAWGSGATGADFSVNPTLAINPNGQYTCYPPSDTYSSQGVQVSSITLPNNEQYTFTYDTQTGELMQVNYPDGGSISYTWKVDDMQNHEQASYDGQGRNVAGALVYTAPGGCIYRYSLPQVASRTVNYGNGSGITQTYSYKTIWGSSDWTQKTTTVTTTDMQSNPPNQSFQTVYTYSPQQVGTNTDLFTRQSSTQVPVESTIQYYDWGSSKILRTVHKAWSGDLMTCEVDTLDDGVTSSGKWYTYLGDIVTDLKEYDYGAISASGCSNTSAPSGFSRETKTPVNIVATPRGGSIWELASRTVLNGAGSSVAETDYSYDLAPIQAITAVTGLPTGTHDETNYAAGSTGKRGNVTTKTEKCFTGTTPCANNSITTYAYDETGKVVELKDPCGNATCSDMSGTAHTTSYIYTDSPSGGNPPGNSNAYLTQVIYPNTGVAHSESYQYNYASGQLSQTKDQNKILTNYSYEDPLNRLTLIDSAPGTINWATNASAESKTSYAYPSLTETDASHDLNTTGDAVLKSSTFYDGLGRAIKSVARDGSMIRTAYNGVNQVCAVSNPTFTDPGPLSCTVGANKAVAVTDGYTYFTYDGLGRKKMQTQPDLTTRTWLYTDNVVNFSDETSSLWQWTYDSFGRLTKTLEDGPVTKVLTLETDHTYDLLDNLLSVNQLGASGDTPRYRTFTYDSLSRLTNACNPETIKSGGVCTLTAGPWSAAYAYDANGNVIKRTDARGIATNYTYDAMNRVTAKSYTNDPANTPALSYGYDSEYAWQQVQDENNAVGHLNSIMATLGTTNLTTWTSGDWDQRGNSIGYVNCLGSNAQGCPGAGVGANYAYNLNDDLTGLSADAYITNYNGELDLSYGFDTSGRPNSIVTGVRLGATGTPLTSTAFSGLTYAPGGAVETANLAIDPMSHIAGIALSRTYDNRGRITGEADTSSLKQSAYSYSVSYDGSGSVKAFNDSVAGAWTVSNDDLHRLAGLSGNVKGVPVSMQEIYDSFGNRNVEYYTYNGTKMQPSPFLNFYTSNRASGYSYDYAGNLLSDGSNNYLYDAENRICAVQQTPPLTGTYGYVYAANGPLLGVGSLSSFTCDLTKNGLLTANGLALTNAYMAGPQGERLIEVNGGFNLLHYNVFWEGKLLGTFSGTTAVQTNWHFSLNDWVGTKRVTTTPAGVPWAYVFSGPFGDYQSQTGTGSDPSEEHFTGKPRDTNSNLDYFGARHYNSNLGRFMSPDWSANPVAVPYADINNPQSLNLYSYVKNNPLSHADADGHVQLCGESTASTNANGDTVVNANCVDLPDPPTRTQTIQNWYKSTVVDPWNARIAAHAPPPSASRDTFGAEEIAKAMMIVAGAGWYSKYDTSITKSGSVTNIDTDVSVKSAGENLEANGYTKSTASDGTPLYTKGDTQYSIYSQAKSTGGPTAQVSVDGQVVAKIRLQP